MMCYNCYDIHCRVSGTRADKKFVLEKYYSVLGHKNPLCTAVKDVSLKPELQAQSFYVDKPLIQWLFAFPHFVIEADDNI